jgi:ABC-type transporter Mla MlaB component
MIRLDRWSEGGRRILRLFGTFDGDAALDLVDAIRREVSPDVVVDVALVRGFDEVGVATLARLLDTGAGRRIALRGLSTHQLRILRYLGVRLSGVGAADDLAAR